MMTKRTTSTFAVSDNDIRNFLICPRLFNEFKPTAILPTPQTQVSISSCINRLFVSEMQKGEAFSIKGLGPYWSRRLNELRDAGLYKTQRQINTLRIALNQLGGLFITRLFNKGFKTIAIKYPVLFMADRGMYSTTVPIIMQKRNVTYPLFLHQPGTYPNRNNDVRFAIAALEETLSVDIPEYGLIVPTNSYRNYNLDNIKLSADIRNRARQELKDLLFLMTADYRVCNTNHCNNCEFIHKCKM